MSARTYILIFLFSCISSYTLNAQSAYMGVQIIQNNTGITSTSIKEARQIFRVKYSRWPSSGEQVIIALPSPKSASAPLVAKVIYNASVNEMQKFWLSIVFQGRAAPPVFLETDEEVVRFVAKNPGAIGVISASSAVTIPPGFQLVVR